MNFKKEIEAYEKTVSRVTELQKRYDQLLQDLTISRAYGATLKKRIGEMAASGTNQPDRNPFSTTNYGRPGTRYGGDEAKEDDLHDEDDDFLTGNYVSTNQRVPAQKPLTATTPTWESRKAGLLRVTHD